MQYLMARRICGCFTRPAKRGRARAHCSSVESIVAVQAWRLDSCPHLWVKLFHRSWSAAVLETYELDGDGDGDGVGWTEGW